MIRKITSLFISLLFTSISIFAQQGIHGAGVVSTTNTRVNEYTALTADANQGFTILTVASSTLNANGRFGTVLVPGDLIMIYEVQGAFIRNQFDVSGPADTVWGKVTDYFQCGKYEFAQVKAVLSPTLIEVDCGIKNDYRTTNGQKAQVIRVPRYTTLTVLAGDTLTCDDWNGTIGGVLAVEVQGNTVINAGGVIHANGKGFRGGSLVGDNVTSFGVNNTYATNNALGGEKGEGIVGYQSAYDIFGGRYCRAPGANAGGGGNAHNGGGGGGANAPNSTSPTAIWSGNGVPDQTPVGWTAAWNREPPINTMSLRTNANSAGGGRGGYTFSSSNQNATLTGPGNALWGGDNRNHESTGLGGRPLDYSTGRIFFGGGGGAGDQNQLFGGEGGDGGGFIYLMVYGTISGSGTVSANGHPGRNATGPAPNTTSYGGADAAGGGGGGGAIVLNAVGGVAGITANTNGGNGGNQILVRGVFYVGAVNEAEGPGGGGGGGYIAVSSGAITRNSNGGNNGTTNSDALTEFNSNGATRGCPGTNNATITNFDITLTNQTICAGQSATIPVVISGTPPVGYTINWYASSTGGNPFATGTPYVTPALAVGTYTYWVGTCGGWWREPVTITVVAAPTVTVSSTSLTMCTGGSVTLTAGGATTYTWMPGSLSGTSVVVSPGVTTTYTVTGTLGVGCVDTETITITVNPTPTVTTTAGTNPICAGSSTSLTGNGAATYVWNPGNVSGSPITVSPLVNTTYTVVGTTAAGCTSSAQLTVTVNPRPTVTATAAVNPICVGGSASLTGGGAVSYVWNPGNISGSPISVTPATTTTYTVTGTGANGCTNTAQLTVTVSPTPTVTATAATNPICSGSSVTLTANGATTYNWMPGSLTGTSVSVSPAVTTSYTVTGTTGTCTSTAIITVTVNATPTVTSTAGTNPICAGSSTSLTGGGASTYVWNPGNVSGSPITVSPLVNTTYTVTGTAANGCTATSQLTVTVNPRPTVTATAAVNPICVGGSASLTGGGAVSYVWNPGNISGSPISVTPAVTTTYTVTGTGANGCTNTAQLTVTVSPTPTVTVTAATNPICAGSSVTLTSNGATTYNWMPGSLTGSSVSVSPAVTTSYTVTGTTGTCTSTAIITVTVNPTPTVTSTAGTNPICAGSSTSLTGGGAATYVWNPGNVSGSPISVSPAITTTYTVVGTAANGCTSSSQLTVTVNPLPVVTSTAATNPICAGSSVSISGSGASTYVWNPGNISGSPISVTPAITTTYTVTGTGANGCTNTSQLTVTVVPTPTVTATASTNPICDGSSTTLTTSGATTYNWMPGSLTGSSVTVSPAVTTSYTVTGTTGTCTSTAIITVTVNPTPTVTSTAAINPICAGTTIAVSASGASTYVWNPGNFAGTSINVTPLTTTTYTVTGTAANGCTSTSPLTVTVNPLPTVTITPASSSVCSGGSVSITASGASTYGWMPGSLTGATQILSPSATTTYTITGTGANGCADTAQITITVNPLPVITAASGSPAICIGDSATLTSTGGNSYVWNPGALTGSSINVAPAVTTTYTVTGTGANSCSDTAQVTVIVNPLPIITASAVPPAICLGQSISLNSTGGTSYNWNGGALVNASGASQSETPVSSTTYSVTVTDGNGCSDSTTVAVTVNPLPVADAGADQSVCAGGSVNLNGNGGGTYVWNGGTLVNASGASQTDIPTAQTDYVLQVTDGNGCVDNDTINVVVNALPPVFAGIDVQICLNSTVALNATGAQSYVWTPATALDNDSIANPNASPLVTTTYVVTGTDTNGCVASDTMVVTIGNNLTVVASADITICPGDTAQLSISGGTIWTWTPSATLDAPTGSTTNAFPTTTTTYTVNVSDANGCQGVDSVTVFINSNVGLSVTGNATICIGDSTTLNATPSGGTLPYTYTWDNSLAGNGTQVVSPVVTTTYNVYVTDSIGCNSPTQSITVIVNPPLTLSSITGSNICAGSSINLTASGSGGDNNLVYTWLPGNLNGPNQTVSPSVTTTYTIILSDGCTTPPDTGHVTITVVPLPVVSLASDVTTGCGPLCVNFTATSSANCATSAWLFGDGNTSTQSSPTNCYQLPGAYDVTYTCTDANGCVGTVTTTGMINVVTNPVAAFTVTPSGTIQVDQGNPQQICAFDMSTNATAWSWELTGGVASQTSNQQNPCFTISDTGVYVITLIVTNAQGCTDTVVSTVIAENPCTDLYVPTAFSPNGDSQNDVFFMYGSCIKFMQLEIYNRWGEQVFITTNPANGWDGTWRGQACEAAVFTYVLTGQMNDGTPIEQQGHISLIR